MPTEQETTSFKHRIALLSEQIAKHRDALRACQREVSALRDEIEDRDDTLRQALDDLNSAIDSLSELQ